MLLAAAASLLLLLTDYHFNYAARVRSVVSVALYPLYVVARAPFGYLDSTASLLRSRRALLEENERLRARSLLIASRLQRYQALEAENRRLRELLESSFHITEQVLVAELISLGLQPHNHRMVIDKGRQAGVYPGQAMVDANGVLGQVLHSGPLTSTIILLTDPRHAVPVEIRRTGLRGVAVGTGNIKELQIQYIAGDADVRQGDIIVSSGLGNIFPAGYQVGTITGIEVRPGKTFAVVRAAPSAQLERSREFLLVSRQDPG